MLVLNNFIKNRQRGLHCVHIYSLQVFFHFIFHGSHLADFHRRFAVLYTIAANPIYKFEREAELRMPPIFETCQRARMRMPRRMTSRDGGDMTRKVSNGNKPTERRMRSSSVAVVDGGCCRCCFFPPRLLRCIIHRDVSSPTVRATPSESYVLRLICEFERTLNKQRGY